MEQPRELQPRNLKLIRLDVYPHPDGNGGFWCADAGVQDYNGLEGISCRGSSALAVVAEVHARLTPRSRIFQMAARFGSSSRTLSGAKRFIRTGIRRRLPKFTVTHSEQGGWRLMALRRAGMRPDYKNREEWRREKVAQERMRSLDLLEREDWEGEVLLKDWDLMDECGPVGFKKGAGRLIQEVRYTLRDAPYCENRAAYGDQSCVPHRYSGRVMDHHVIWRIPYGHQLEYVREAANHVVCTPGNSRTPERIWIARKGVGYSGRWEELTAEQARRTRSKKVYAHLFNPNRGGEK